MHGAGTRLFNFFELRSWRVINLPQMRIHSSIRYRWFDRTLWRTTRCRWQMHIVILVQHTSEHSCPDDLSTQPHTAIRAERMNLQNMCLRFSRRPDNMLTWNNESACSFCNNRFRRNIWDDWPMSFYKFEWGSGGHVTLIAVVSDACLYAVSALTCAEEAVSN